MAAYASSTQGPETQSALLALLCFRKKSGLKISAVLDESYFDGIHKDVATAVFKYRRKYNKAPGKSHLPILIEQLPVQEERLKAVKALAATLPRVLRGLNVEYTISRAVAFSRFQNFKQAISSSVDELGKSPINEAAVVEAVEGHMLKALKSKSVDSMSGARLGDVKKSLLWIGKENEGYLYGIGPLDDIVGVRLKPKTLTLYAGPKNSGKSWACVHIARTCVMQGAKVLYVTLEMSQDQCFKRMYQSWFAISQTAIKYSLTRFEHEAEEGLKRHFARGFKQTDVTPKHHSKDPISYIEGNPRLGGELKRKVEKWQSKLDRLFVQEYPTGSLTLNQLKHHLDYLSEYKDFQPEVLIVDYPDLMQLDRKQLRQELNAVYIGLRGIAVERNIALFCPTQVNRQGMTRNRVQATDISEAIDKAFTADVVLTYSQSPTERECNRAVLKVAYARDAPRDMEVWISQAYAIGQYVVDAAVPTKQFKASARAREAEGGDSQEGDEDGGEADDTGLV